MLMLHEDFNFHYEAMRAIGTVPYGGADIMEVFDTLQRVKPYDFESWYTEWFKLAKQVLSAVDEKSEAGYSPVTLRNTYFRASHYFCVADFFLHGNKSDPRMVECYDLWTKYFDRANSYLPIPGKRVTIKADGFDVPAMFFRAAEASESSPRPTLLIGGGFESVMEETYHVFGVAALERGYKIVLYEGPGHRRVVNQGMGFVAEWERAVNPLVDYIIAQNKSGELSFIDTDKLGLIGMSLGGYLAARAAAFEPRLAAVICIDGVWDFLETVHSIMPNLKEAYEKGDKELFDCEFEAGQSTWDTNRRWVHDDLLYGFNSNSAYDVYKVCEKMTLANGVAEKIKMPAFIGDATADMFFEGQPERVAKTIGPNATHHVFGPDQGAQLHCQSGALIHMNGVLMEWFAGVVGH
ncbi:2,6-dihydropseudooxynicotine hydrolase [Sarocladium strictum]